MERDDLHDKLSSIKPYTFYGDDPPRRLSKEPSKILQPLMEWAEKTHFRKGGLAGHRLQHHVPAPPKRPRNAYRLFFEDSKEKLLAKGGHFTRDEIQAVTPSIKKMWLEATAETLSHYQSLAKKEMVMYEEEMRKFEHAYPEIARQLKIKEHQRKARTRRAKELKKGLEPSTGTNEPVRRRKAPASITKKVSKWLDEADLTVQDTPQGEGSAMECETDDDDSTSTSDTDASSREDGFHGAYRFP